MASSKLNTLGAQILFAEAKARLESILKLIDEFNDISKDLEAMGYGPVDYGDGLSKCEWPMPSLDLCQNNTMSVDAADILDAFWEQGPQRGSNTQPIRRSSRTTDRHRLGNQSAWVCFYCRGVGDYEVGPDKRTWHVDHVYPVAAGGDDLPDNLVLACATCNLEKKTRTANEYFAMKAKV